MYVRDHTRPMLHHAMVLDCDAYDYAVFVAHVLGVAGVVEPGPIVEVDAVVGAAGLSAAGSCAPAPPEGERLVLGARLDPPRLKQQASRLCARCRIFGPRTLHQ